MMHTAVVEVSLYLQWLCAKFIVIEVVKKKSVFLFLPQFSFVCLQRVIGRYQHNLHTYRVSLFSNCLKLVGQLAHSLFDIHTASVHALWKCEVHCYQQMVSNPLSKEKSIDTCSGKAEDLY